MKYGDLVEAIPPFSLACGSGRYPYAVVMTPDPIVIISATGDMRWSETVMEKDLKVIGEANPAQLKAARTRYDRDWKLNEL